MFFLLTSFLDITVPRFPIYWKINIKSVKIVLFLSQQSGIIQRDLYPLTPSNVPSMRAREWIDQGLNRNPNLMDLLADFPLQDGEVETRDMRSREEREASGGRPVTVR